MSVAQDVQTLAQLTVCERAVQRRDQALAEWRLAKTEHDRTIANVAEAEAHRDNLQSDVANAEAEQKAAGLLLSSSPSDPEIRERLHAAARKLVELRATLQAIEEIALPSAISAEASARSNLEVLQQGYQEAAAQVKAAALYDKLIELHVLAAGLMSKVQEVSSCWDDLDQGLRVRLLRERACRFSTLVVRALPEALHHAQRAEVAAYLGMHESPANALKSWGDGYGNIIRRELGLPIDEEGGE